MISVSDPSASVTVIDIVSEETSLIQYMVAPSMLAVPDVAPLSVNMLSTICLDS